MNLQRFIFDEIDSDESMERLAFRLGTSLTKGFLHIPGDIGSGTIRKIELDDGANMRVWDLSVKQPIFFHKRPWSDAVDQKSFHIIYILDPSILYTNKKFFKKPVKELPGKNILFFSNDSELQFEVNAGNKLCAIDISVTSCWLRHAYSTADSEVSTYIQRMSEKTRPTMFLESCSPDEFRVLAEIINSYAAGSALQIKAESLLLIAEFFNRMSRRSKEEIAGKKIFYHIQIIRAKQLLIENLERPFPGVEAIAREVSLSQSTLKRYFKLLFNKGINEYFLELKMEKAKRLFLENPLSVNEVASIVGYEKTSSFIEIFKKHHGYPPGRLKKVS